MLLKVAFIQSIKVALLPCGFAGTPGSRRAARGQADVATAPLAFARSSRAKLAGQTDAMAVPHQFSSKPGRRRAPTMVQASLVRRPEPGLPRLQAERSKLALRRSAGWQRSTFSGIRAGEAKVGSRTIFRWWCWDTCWRQSTRSLSARLRSYAAPTEDLHHDLGMTATNCADAESAIAAQTSAAADLDAWLHRAWRCGSGTWSGAWRCAPHPGSGGADLTRPYGPGENRRSPTKSSSRRMRCDADGVMHSSSAASAANERWRAAASSADQGIHRRQAIDQWGFVQHYY